MLPALKASLGGLPRSYWVLWTGTLINRLGTFVIPFLLIYLTTQRHLEVDQAGLLLSLFGVGALFANPLGGALADRIGRKPTMIFSFVMTAGAVIMLAFAQTLWQLGLALVWFGLMNDLFRPAQMAVIADVVPPKDRLRAFSHMYWAINLGAGVGPLVAGFVAKNHFFALFVVDAITTLICAGLILWKVPETRPELTEKQRKSSPFAGMLEPFKDRVFAPYVLVSFVMIIVFFQFVASLPADMKAHGLGEDNYGQTVAVNGFLIVLLQPLLTQRIGRWNRARVLAAAAALIGVGYGVYAFAGGTLWVWMFGMAILTFGEILMAPVNSTVVADLSPMEMRGRYQAAYNMAWSFSWIVSPAVGTLVLKHAGSVTLWVGCAVVGFIAAGLQLAIGPARRRRVLELHGEAKLD